MAWPSCAVGCAVDRPNGQVPREEIREHEADLVSESFDGRLRTVSIDLGEGMDLGMVWIRRDGDRRIELRSAQISDGLEGAIG